LLLALSAVFGSIPAHEAPFVQAREGGPREGGSFEQRGGRGREDVAAVVRG
jgi:hypothetical protein